MNCFTLRFIPLLGLIYVLGSGLGLFAQTPATPETIQDPSDQVQPNGMPFPVVNYPVPIPLPRNLEPLIPTWERPLFRIHAGANAFLNNPNGRNSVFLFRLRYSNQLWSRWVRIDQNTTTWIHEGGVEEVQVRVGYLINGVPQFSRMVQPANFQVHPLARPDQVLEIYFTCHFIRGLNGFVDTYLAGVHHTYTIPVGEEAQPPFQLTRTPTVRITTGPNTAFEGLYIFRLTYENGQHTRWMRMDADGQTGIHYGRVAIIERGVGVLESTGRDIPHFIPGTFRAIHVIPAGQLPENDQILEVTLRTDHIRRPDGESDIHVSLSALPDDVAIEDQWPIAP